MRIVCLKLICLGFFLQAFFWLMGCAHIENGYSAACEGLIDLSQNFDGFFADPKDDDEYYDSRWKIGGGGRMNRDREFELAGKHSLRIALPGTRETWGMLIGGSTEHETLPDSSDVRQPGMIQTGGPDIYRADGSITESESFLRFYTKREMPFKWDFDVGVRYNNDWQTFVRLRAKRQGIIVTNPYYFAQEVYWRNTQEELGIKTTFEIDQHFGDDILLREFIDVFYHQASDGLDIYTGLKLRSFLGDKLGVAVEWVNFLTTNPWSFRYMDFVCRIRRSIGRDWFEMELTPRLRMRRIEQEWRHEMSVEVIFAVIIDADHVRTNNKRD